MRFSIRVIVKEDDGSTLRGDNKKMVSSLRIPTGIDSSTRTPFFGAFQIGNCKMQDAFSRLVLVTILIQ